LDDVGDGSLSFISGNCIAGVSSGVSPAAFGFGSFVDLNLFLIGADLPFGWFGVILYITLSVLCVSFGITLYVDADLLQMPTEGLLSALAKKYPEKLPFHRGKLFSDSLLVIAAVILSMSILGEVRGVGIATVISALGNGRMVRVFEKLFEYVRKNRNGC